MASLEDAVDSVAGRTGFSGVVRVDRATGVEFASAYGLADRRHGIANTVDTQFGLASGTKGLTALAVVSLVEDGALDAVDDGPFGPGRGSAAHRRRRDGGTPAVAPIGHR